VVNRSHAGCQDWRDESRAFRRSGRSLRFHERGRLDDLPTWATGRCSTWSLGRCFRENSGCWSIRLGRPPSPRAGWMVLETRQRPSRSGSSCE